MDAEILALSMQLGALLHARQLKIATVESCTGGGIAQAITSVAGSSAWFDMGLVTYANHAKEQLVGVSPQTLLEFGAVSQETVREMASGALVLANADIAVATSGVAGPGGGSADKPVGLVWFAWAIRKDDGVAIICESKNFIGDRNTVQRLAVQHALTSTQKKILDCCM